MPERTWSNHTIVTYKLQFLWRVWTLPVQGRNLTSCSEFMSESDPVAKNPIEFQWGSKLQGTSSEAVVWTYKIQINVDACKIVYTV